MLIFCSVANATAQMSVARELRLPAAGGHSARPGGGNVMRYPNKSLKIPLETFSKVAPEKLPWAMLHQLGGKPP